MTAIASLVSLIMPLVIKLILLFLDYKQSNDETKRLFLDFVKALSDDIPNSNKLKDAYEKAREENKKKLGITDGN